MFIMLQLLQTIFIQPIHKLHCISIQPSFPYMLMHMHIQLLSETAAHVYCDCINMAKYTQ